MKKTICDVCGQEVNSKAYKIGFKPVLMNRTTYAFEWHMEDICDECFCKIRKIIREKQNEKERI